MQNRIGTDNICPETGKPCLDECCPPGAICNLSESSLQDITMQKIYCRSIREDGYGEGVVPEMEQPTFDYDFPTDGPSDTMLESAYDDFDLRVKRWYDHINSLPVLYLIHPELHKGKVGWVGEYMEVYKVYNGTNWHKTSKGLYDRAAEDVRRLILVPVEGNEFKRCGEGENVCNCKSEDECGYKEQPADKAEGKEVGSTFEGWPEKYPNLQSVTEEEKDQIIEELTKTVTKNVLATFKALGLKTHMQASVYDEHFGEWFQFSFIKCANEQQANQYPKPIPVTGEAVDYFSTWLKSEVATLSREVSMSKAMNGMFDKIHLQILHKRLTEVLDKYQLFKQQTIKP